MKNNICYFIHTCDEYAKFWSGWFDSFQKFWPKDLNWNVYFVNETDDVHFTDSRIKQIKTFKTKKEYVKEEREFDTQGNPFPQYGMMKQFDYGWTDRLLYALDQIDEEYLLWVQEDMWLKTDVNANLFENAYRFVERNDFNVLRIHRINSMASPYSEFYNKTDLFINDYSIIKINNNAGYLMSHQPSIWKKSFLKEVQIPGESFRDNEFEGTERIRKYEDPKIYHLIYDWCHGIPGAATQGNFHTYSYEQEAIEHKNDLKMYDDYNIIRSKYNYSKDQLKLSLVTSCYNAEKYIDDLSNSVLNQQYQNWEWIIADDFSSDNTLQKLNNIQSLDQRIRIVYPKHKKEIWWNPQIHATGDIVCHLDADDILFPNTLDLLVHYFNTFPDVVLMHFNASKYKEKFPNKEDILENYLNNVYVTDDNDSFLEGYSKLWPNRSNMFGYLRVFRNLKNLHFPEHDDALGECVPNDGQWLITMEEKGKWLYVPRTIYLARNHGDSENHRNWNIRGDTKLIKQAKERRKKYRLEYPRNIKYFDEIHNLAESTFTSKLNFETQTKKISFINFDIQSDTEHKLQTLIPDHEVCINKIDDTIDYYYVNIFTYNTFHIIRDFLLQIKNCNSDCEVILYCRNAYQHIDNRTNQNNLHQIINELKDISPLVWFEQDNRFFSRLTFTGDNNMEFLNIIQVNPGYGVSVPPRSYGGIEQVVQHYISAFENKGHNVKIKPIGEITQNDIEFNDVIHCHTLNYYSQLKEKNIPYIFTIHDVHPFKPGYEHLQNKLKEVIHNSLITTCPSKTLIESLGSPENLIHVNHGVDTNFFYPIKEIEKKKQILCIGSPEDRKGFHLAIEAANTLNLPVIIAGPLSPTQSEYNSMLEEYKKNCNIEVNILGDITKNELRKIINESTVVVHPANLETGQPCLSVMESLACGTPVVGTIQDDIEIGGFVKCERDVNSIIRGIDLILKNYKDHSSSAREFAKTRNLDNIYNNLKRVYDMAVVNKKDFKNDFIDKARYAYENVEKNKALNSFFVNYEPNPKITVLGPDRGNKYKISFTDKTNGISHYSHNELAPGQWAATSISHYIPWKLEATDNLTNEVVFSEELDLTGKKVHIIFDSKSLGDSIAWMAPVESFRLKHKCELSVATFQNELFQKVYPNIKFVKPNTGYEKECFISYWLGYYNSGPRSPFDRKDVSLQQLGAGILGFNDYPETLTRIHVDDSYEINIKKPYVTIAVQSTLQAKYWNADYGWDKVVLYLKEKGYEVVCVDKDQIFGRGNYMNRAPLGVIGKHNRPLAEIVNIINNSEFFIGLGSGLSWVSWALKKPTILISGFSNPKSEFKSLCYRIFNNNVCNSCYNRHELDPGNWTWCPDHENTDRMFECTKNISPEKVFEAIDIVRKTKRISLVSDLAKPVNTK